MFAAPFNLGWGDVFRPILHRSRRLQVAALCHREVEGERQVLLVTSRGTGRWIVPKGWPIDGLDSRGSALQEAWEEAGVRSGDASFEPIGTFTYDKRMPGGASVPIRALVFDVAVDRLEDDFPEADERYRTWVAPEVAATMVKEPELRDILRGYRAIDGVGAIPG